MAKSLRLLAVACTLFFAVAGGALAKDLQFADENCAITLPDTWLELTNLPRRQGQLAVYSDAARKRFVLLCVSTEKPSGPMDDRVVADFELGIRKSGGGERISGQYVEVAGIKSYERSGALDSHGKHLSTINLFVPGEDKYYSIQGMRSDGDASDDPEIQQIIGSFRFLHPFVPSYVPNPDSPEAKFAQTTTKLILTIAAVAFVVYCIVSSLRRRPASRPPPVPPPLPSRPPPLPPGASRP